MKPDPENIPELIEHNGWTIWCWTGWKGSKSVLHNGFPANEAPRCIICDTPMIDGQAIELSQGRLPKHWICAYPDNPLDRRMGQWLAVKGEPPNQRYLEVNVDNLDPRCIRGHEYKKGESFEVSQKGEFITENTPEADRERARWMGLELLKALINAKEVETH